jgi:hypothetical protein
MPSHLLGTAFMASTPPRQVVGPPGVEPGINSSLLGLHNEAPQLS